MSTTPIFTAAHIADPYPAYRRLQSETPIHWDSSSRQLLVTRYADVVAALKHPDLSSRRVAETALPLPGVLQTVMRPMTRLLALGMLFSDPPDHTRLRGLASRAFTPRVVEGMRGRIEAIAEELLDAAERRGAAADLIGEYAAWLPILVIGELLGVPVENRTRLKLWSDDAVQFIGGTTQPAPVVLARAARGIFALRAYLAKVVRSRRKEPGDDLLSALIAAEAEGDRLNEEELLANALLLLAAGHETTTNLIGNGLLLLLRHPDQMERLRREPELLESAVEEVLRFEPPVLWTARVALRDLEIAGRAIPEGQIVAMGLAAANRDPAQFPEPDRFDVSRTENRHVAFGHGIHFCLGAALARLEGEVAIGAVLRRYPDLRLADAKPEWRENFTLRGLKRLSVWLR